MAKPELGTKRTCPECEARFYDLGKMPCECPKCEHSFEPEILLKSKKRVVEADKPKPKPAEAASDDDDEEEEETGVEEVTAEGMVKMPAEVDEDGLAVAPGDDDDDDVAEIDVALVPDDDDDDNEDDNTTLVNFDDDEDDVAATIVPDLGKTKDE